MINASILDGMSILNKRMNIRTNERRNESTEIYVQKDMDILCYMNTEIELIRCLLTFKHIHKQTSTPHTIAKTEIAIYTMPMSIAMLWL